MISPASPLTDRKLRWIASACGGLAVVVAVLVLIGWWFGIASFKSVFPGLVTMKPNTALAFVFAGTALMLQAGAPVSSRRVRTGQWLAVFVALIGALTLCEFFLDWQLGVDEVLFKEDPNAALTLIPGRMALVTAVCFVLLGLAMLGIEWEPRRGLRPAEVLALVVAGVSSSSLVEYAVGQPILFSFSQYTRMALHTAVVCPVLSAGVLLARPAQGMLGALRAGGVTRLERVVYPAVGLALAIVLAGGAWFYHDQEQQMQRAVEAELEAIARLKVDQIVQWRGERLGDAAVLVGSQFFAEGVKRWLADPQPDLAGKIFARLGSMLQNNRYSDALLVDGRGQPQFAFSGGAGGLHPEDTEALATAFQEQRPVLTELHVGPATQTPHAHLIAPLFQANGETPQLIGAVVLTIDARQFLYPLIQSWPTASPSAETLLVRRDGDDAVFLNDLRHRPDTAFNLRIPLTERGVPAVMAALGAEGLFHGSDYRGGMVLSVIKRIPDTSWSMVAKIDEAEVLAEWRFRANLIMATIAALVLALAASARMIAQQGAKYRALSESAEALRKANRLYRVLSEGNQVLVRATQESALLQEVCRIAVEYGGYRLAWVGFTEADEACNVRPVAQFGVEQRYLEGLQTTWADTERGRGPIGTAIRTAKSMVVQDLLHDPQVEPLRAEALQCGYAASVALPLIGQGRTFGVLSVYAKDAHAFDEQELKLLEELADDLAFGIVTLRLRAERDRQEQVLQRKEAELSEAQRLAHIGNWYWDVQTDATTGSDELLRIYGLDPVTESVLPFQEQKGRLYTAENWERVNAAVRQTLQTRVGFELDVEALRADGATIWITARAEAVWDSEGRIVGLRGTVQDVSGRKQEEAQLAAANEELSRLNRGLKVLSEGNQLLVRATEESQLLRDMCTILVDMGGYQFAWVGFAENDSSKTVRPVTWAGHEDGYLRAVRISWAGDDERGRGPIGIAIRTGEPQLITEILSDERFEPWRSEANARGYRSLVAVPLIAAGQALGALVIVSGMTDAFDAQEVKLLKELADDLAHGVAALRARAAQLVAEQRRLEEAEVSGALARIGGELLVSLNTGSMLGHLCQVITDVLSCDYCFTAAWGSDAAVYTPTAAYGLPQELWETIRSLAVPDAGVGYLRERLETAQAVQLSTSAVDSPFARLALQYGVTRSLFVALRRGQEHVGLVGVGFFGRSARFTPIQERIAVGIGQLASIALDHSLVMDALEQANRLKSDFMSTMSHELRTPLNIIMGYNRLMVEEEFGPLTAEQHDTLQRTYKSERELLELINATLDIGRLETGEAPLKMEEVDVRALLEDLHLDASSSGGKPGVAVVRDIASSLPPLQTDGIKLKVIVKNLISNALKFTEQGQVTIGAQPCEDGVEVSVADTGPGIAADVLPIIFEPFRQGESTMTRHYGGVGLGLYIVKRLLELLGGTITVDTEVGRGSTFRVYVPLRPFVSTGLDSA